MKDREEEAIIIKLKLSKNDAKTFEQIARSDIDSAPYDSRLTQNYLYFSKRLEKKEATPKEIFEALEKLVVLYVELDQEDNPQLVFESMNATGLALSDGDKIRNFILMGISPEKQEQFCEQYWNEIERNTNWNTTILIQTWLSLKNNNAISKQNIYSTFKETVRNSEPQQLLKELLSYSRYYASLLFAKHENQKITQCTYRLNWLKITTPRVFLMEVLKLNADDVIPDDDMEEIFKIVEIFCFRRLICGSPSNALKNLFVYLPREIHNMEGECYLEKFKYALLRKEMNGVFPGDEEFHDAFYNSDPYLMGTNITGYILERLNNFGTDEKASDIYEKLLEGAYSIEHIMPKKLSPKWEKELGDDFEEIHGTWLNSIANLTLTAYNSKYSNRSFAEKKTIPNGFRESNIRLNKWIARREEWTLKQMKKRNKMLSDDALKIWPMPQTSYVPIEEEEREKLSLEGTWSWKRPTAFVFDGERTDVYNWQNLFAGVVDMLLPKYKSYIYGFAADAKFSLSSFGGNLRRPVKIADGIFFESNRSAEDFRKTLLAIFEYLEIDPASFSVIL